MLHINEIIEPVLFPNKITIDQVSWTTDEITTLTETDSLKSLIYPVWYHRWKNIKGLFYNPNTHIIDVTYTNNFNLGADTVILKNFYHDKTNRVFVKTDPNPGANHKVTLTETAFSWLRFRKNLYWKDLNLFDYYGLVQEGINLGITTSVIDPKEKLRIKNQNPFPNNKGPIAPVSLASLTRENQIKIFDSWYNKKTIILTGGTGIGKTSQIPKLILWFNYLFGGCKIDNLFWDPEHVGIKKPICLSLPRVELVKQNGVGILKSIGFENFENSPIKLSYGNLELEPNFKNLNFPNWGMVLSTNRLTSKSLEKFDSIIIDEIHEHDTYADIILTILKYKRSEFQSVVAMSATIESDKDRLEYFFDPTFIHIPGKSLYEVQEYSYNNPYDYNENPSDYNFVEESNIIKAILDHPPNKGEVGILFFSKISYINDYYKKLAKRFPNIKFHIIHSKQENIFNRLLSIYNNKTDRMIILSTPYLESSITIPNAKVVYDTGRYWKSHFYSGFEAFVSKSMYQQRRGRVGRTSTGKYISFYNRYEEHNNIDSEFLYPYIMYMKHYNLYGKEFFIMPKNQAKIELAKKYLEGLFEFNSQTFEIFNKYPCTMIEYIPIYLENIYTEELEEYDNSFKTGEVKSLSESLATRLYKMSTKIKVDKILYEQKNSETFVELEVLFGYEKELKIKFKFNFRPKVNDRLHMLSPNKLVQEIGFTLN